MRSSPIFPMSGKIIKSDGDEFIDNHGVTQYLKYDVRAWYNADGEVGGIIMLTEVITTQLKEMQRVVRENSFLRTISESTSHAFISIDLTGHVTTFNQRAEEMLEYKRDEVIGKVTPAIWHDEAEVIAYKEELEREFGEKFLS